MTKKCNSHKTLNKYQTSSSTSAMESRSTTACVSSESKPVQSSPALATNILASSSCRAINHFICSDLKKLEDILPAESIFTPMLLPNTSLLKVTTRKNLDILSCFIFIRVRTSLQLTWKAIAIP